jgi:pyruvate dehydrogenase E1 component alpha subunit
MSSTVVEPVKIKFCQYLDEKSRVVEFLPDFAKNSNSLLELYRWLVRTRLFDAKAVALQRTGKLTTYPSSHGQEAVFVGMGHAMLKNDVLVPSYRDHGALLQRDAKMADILAYWGGDERGNSPCMKSQDFPIFLPVGTQSCQAAGIARAIQLRGENRAVVASIGDGGTSKADFSAALNISGVWNLPLVFVINNNQWAISVHRKDQCAAPTLAQKSIAAGFAGVQVDGNDVIAVRQVVGEALSKARTGEGPGLIEAITYRQCDHTTADDASRYVPEGESEHEWEREPIGRLRKYLEAEDLWTEEMEQALQEVSQAEISEAVRSFAQLEVQAPETIFDYLYDELPDAYIEQRNILRHYKGHHQA